jgi:hypothetical protein
MRLIQKILDNPMVQIGCGLIFSLFLLYIASILIQSQNPTEIIYGQVTVTERQKFGSGMATSYYIITPENKWCEVTSNAYIKLQPGHTYNVSIQRSVPREWIYQEGMSNETIQRMKKVDMDTGMGRVNDLIIGVN